MPVLHLCIDMQGKYGRETEPFSAQEWNSLKREVTRLAGELEERGVPTVYVAYCAEFTPFREGVGMYKDTPLPTAEIMRRKPYDAFEIPLRPESLVAYKRTYSAYQEPSIADYVRRCGYSMIVLSGVFEGVTQITDECVSITAIDFAQNGYKAVISAEAAKNGVPEESGPSKLAARKARHAPFGVNVAARDELLDLVDREPKLPGRISRYRDFLRKPGH